MADYTQAFYEQIPPETLEEVCQVAEAIAREEEEDEDVPLSPIVGYTISDNSPTSSSSDTDPESRNVLNQLNSLLFQNGASFESPKTKARRQKQRRKRRKVMLREEAESTHEDLVFHAPLERAPAGFDDMDTLNSYEQLLCNNNGQHKAGEIKVGFATARGKPISVANDTFKNAETRLTEIDNLDPSELLNLNAQQKANRPNRGFSTATGKSVSVSHDAVKAAQNRLKEKDNLNQSKLLDFKTNANKEASKLIVGFSTAGGKQISVSNDTAKKAETRLTELDNLDPSELLNFNTKQKANRPNRGLSTATGNNVSVSHDAVKAAQKRLEEKDHLNRSELLDFKTNAPNEVNKLVVGFATAGGKQISVSNDTAKKAETRLTELDNLDPSELLNFKAKQKVNRPNRGFSTATGKNISVSPDAVKAAQKSLEEKDNLNRSELLDFKTNAPNEANKLVVGFATARGNQISVANDTFKHAETRLTEIDNLDPSELLNFKAQQKANRPNHGFSTATGKNSPVSPDAVKKAQTLFNDISESKAQVTFTECDIDQEVMDSVSALLADEENDQLNKSEQIESTKEVEEPTMSQNDESTAITMPTKISLIVLDQKIVPMIKIYVARIYPTVYKHKKTDGKTATMSQKQYVKFQRKQENEHRSKQKKMFSEVEIEVKQQMMNKRNGRKRYSGVLRQNILEKMSPDELLDLMEESDDVSSLEKLLSSEVLSGIQIAKSLREDEMRSAIQSEYESRRKALAAEEPTAMANIMVLDVSSNDEDVMLPKNSALISIWRPSEFIMASLREGATFYITNLTPVTFPKPVIQLNTTVRTIFEPTDNLTDIFSKTIRQCYNIKDVITPNFSPCFGEFDVIGLVVSVRPVVGNTGQLVYISDECKNFLGIRFWNSIVEQGLDDVLQEGNFIAISNLQWRMSSPKSRIPQAFAHEKCLFRTNPKDMNLDNLKKEIKAATVFADPKAFAAFSEMALFNILDGRNLTANSSFNHSFGQDSSTSTTPMACSTPMANQAYNSIITPNITPIGSNTSKRLELLESYGEPPPLAPLPIIATPKVTKKFVTPLKK